MESVKFVFAGCLLIIAALLAGLYFEWQTAEEQAAELKFNKDLTSSWSRCLNETGFDCQAIMVIRGEVGGNQIAAVAYYSREGLDEMSTILNEWELNKTCLQRVSQ